MALCLDEAGEFLRKWTKKLNWRLETGNARERTYKQLEQGVLSDSK